MRLKLSLSAVPVLFLFCTLFSASCAQAGHKTGTENIISKGTITDRALSEVSGIAASCKNKNVLWVLNDSGNSASVYALNPDGKLVGTLKIQGVFNNDWEDIACFEFEGKSYILIADTGDNYAKRSKYFLHFIEEPDLVVEKKTQAIVVKPSWSITYTYEDGARDCESVAFDAVNKKIILLSKRDTPPVLYELPLKKSKNAVAKKVSEIKPFSEKSDDFLAFGVITSQPTAMDISADGLSAIVLTYDSSYLFRKKSNEKWAEVFKSDPIEISVPKMRQSESVCFKRDGSGIFVTSEKIPAPLYEIDISLKEN